MTFTLMSEKDLWYPLERHSAVGGWEQNNANVHAWDCLGMGLEWTRATPPKDCPTVDSTYEEKAQETLNNSTALSTWLAKVEAKLLLSPLCTFWNEEMYPWMFFANITVGKSATIIIAFNATILQNIFQNILYLQQEHFWGHVEKGNAHYYTFSVFHTNKCTNFVYLNEH